MKRILICLYILAVVSSCKEETAEPEVQNQSDGWLLDPATGWEHVMTIPYEKPAEAREGIDQLLGFDMTLIGNEIGILYSANYYLEDEGPVRQFYKIKFKENESNVGSGTKLDVVGTSKRNTFHSQLIPNTLIPVFINFAGTEQIELIDENDSRMTAMLTNKAEDINYHYSANGNFVGAGLDNTYASHLWSLHYPEKILNTPDFKTPKDRGSFETTIVLPSKLSDEQYYTVNIGTQGPKTLYEVLKLAPDKDFNTEINYEIILGGELTGIPASNLKGPGQSLVTYDVQSDVITFVLADFADINSPQINKLHCYRWNRSLNTLVTLWETEPISVNLSKGIQTNPHAEYKYRENRLTPEGTLYTLYTKVRFDEPEVGSQYTVLYTVNLAGVHESGRLEELYNNSVIITTCRYMNGTYYALVYPWENGTIKKDDPKFHLEVVKLNP